jgi:RNA polymerase sigma-70 factor (ECF subfamily)
MTDQELMDAICNGDQTAYQVVVKRFLASISHYAYRLLGNSKDTEDIAQETFLRVWLNASSWRGDQAMLSTWIYRIAHNLCIDYLRKHGRMQTQDRFEEQSSSEANPGNTADGDGDGDDKVAMLSQSIDKLPENQRSALALCHYQNFSNKEAAAIMGVSVKALESLISRAKRTLKNSVAAQTETLKQQ